ncbi:hypothetical protein [Streptomyces erythrochromogenes]|uniref:hypothetical protein n=1 Tax=Streptomyces erythrochromogenes TaxID=285574 RepID=UPI0036C41384
MTTVVCAWPLPGGDRWVGLALGEADKEFRMELLAAVGPLAALGGVRDGKPADGT